jgi:hypothetical protein
MAKIDKLSVSFNGLLPVIAKAVGEWKPPLLKSEIAYRDDLMAFIRSIVPEDARVEREYRHRGTTMDLWLGWKGLMSSDEIAFELKLNFKKKTDFDRLIGQIEGLEPRKNKTLLVLIGETDLGLLGRVQEKYSAQIKASTETPTLAIVLVPTPEK